MPQPPRFSKRIVTTILGLGMLGACGGTPATDPEGASSGVEISGDPTILQASDVHIVGSSESIATVEDLEVLPDGTVWVLNSVDPFFVGFGPNGEAPIEHGSPGGGPGEFSAPVGFVAGGIDGAAWTFDVRRHALIEVSRPDAARAEILIPRDSIPPGSMNPGMGMMIRRVRTARVGDEIIVARSFGSIREGLFDLWLQTWGAKLLALDRATGSARGIVDLGEVLGDPMPHLRQRNGFPPLPLWLRLWSACSDTHFRVYDRLGNQVRGFTSDGAEMDPIPLPDSYLREVTDRQFAMAVIGFSMAERLGQVGGSVSPADSQRVLNEMIQQVEGEPDQLAAFLPRYVDMRCADDGTIWIQPIEIDLGLLQGGLAWYRITPDGVADEVRLPEGFNPYRFTSGRIWGVQLDEFDIASVAWIEPPANR